jgi:hypothetical protein
VSRVRFGPVSVLTDGRSMPPSTWRTRTETALTCAHAPYYALGGVGLPDRVSFATSMTTYPAGADNAVKKDAGKQTLIMPAEARTT